MKILLINNNPVVSRLTALSARKEDIEIDEIQEVTELNSDHYDIVFVDAESWSKDVNDVISENIKIKKTVLFYSEDDEEEKKYFDIAILKPFLPSEVSAVIRSVEASSLNSVSEEEHHFNVLEDTKANNNEKFDLEGLDELEDKKEEVTSSLNEKEVSFDEKLEEAFPLEKNELFDLDLKEDSSSLDDDLFAEDNIKKEKSKEEDFDKFDLELEEDNISEMQPLTQEESSDALSKELFSLELDEPKEDELKVDVLIKEEETTEETKKETKILDASEIENIKGILTEETSDEMSLEDLMTPPMAVISSDIESTTKEQKSSEAEPKKVKVEKKVDNEVDFDTNVLSQTLAAMPVENLRELLAGAKVNIKIKFPKSKS
jgi:hypothetical protein